MGVSTTPRGALSAVVAVFVVWAAVPALAADSESPGVVVTAIHAIPGEQDFPADVYVGGELAISGFIRMEKTDAFTVAEGPLQIDIYPAGADPDASDPALSDTVDLEEGTNVTLVAQLTPDGEPVLSVYRNDTSPVAAGEARLVVRQTSNVAELDVLVDGDSLVADIASTGEETLVLPAGTYEVSLVASGGSQPLASANVELIDGQMTALYAVSTLAGDSVDIAVQTIPGLQTAPSDVPSGTGGLAADPALPAWLPVVLLGAVAVATIGLGTLFRRRD